MLSKQKLDGGLGVAIDKMTAEIQRILSDNKCTMYIYGSVALDDFKLGWSDIDILCLTEAPIAAEAAEKLVVLRQALLADEPDNAYYRSFEGAIVHRDEFLHNASCRAVYWGTSGQRLTEKYVLDIFSKKELLEAGILLQGEDIRSEMKMPSFRELYDGIVYHYETMRKYAVDVPRHVYSYGWLLDTARCIYTLRTGELIAKTAAAQWALENGLCPVPEALERALILRKAPLKYKNDDEIMGYTEVLGKDIQRFADVLELEIANATARIS